MNIFMWSVSIIIQSVEESERRARGGRMIQGTEGGRTGKPLVTVAEALTLLPLQSNRTEQVSQSHLPKEQQRWGHLEEASRGSLVYLCLLSNSEGWVWQPSPYPERNRKW